MPVDQHATSRWNGASAGLPSAPKVLTRTLAPPAEATVIRPAGGCSSVGPFCTAARVAAYTQLFTSRSKPTVYSLLPATWLPLRELPATAPPPELIAALKAVPAGPAAPVGPAGPGRPGVPRREFRAPAE